MKKLVYPLLTLLSLTLTSCGSKYPPHKGGEFCNVNFVGYDGVTSDAPTFAKMDRDLEINLNIPYIDHDDAIWVEEPTKESEGRLNMYPEEYYVLNNDIKVLIGGKEYDDSWYYYSTDKFTHRIVVKKEYVVNDIDIQVHAHKYDHLFLYGIIFGDELIDRWEFNEGKEEDDPKYTHDLRISFQTFYQRKQYPIKTIDGQVTFPVIEHDNIDVTIEIVDNTEEGDYTDHVPLPDDIRFRKNSRYAAIDVDFTREYSDSYVYTEPVTKETTQGFRKCHLTVPNLVIDDHCKFAQYGTE